MYAIKKSNLRAVIFALAGKKALNLDADERRALQLQVTGKASLSDMSAPEMENVVHHLRRLQHAQQQGTPPANPWAFVFKMAPERQAMAKKVYRLAEKIGALQDPPVGVMSVEYIEGISRRMAGTDHPLEFCDATQLHKIVQALEVYAKRHGG